MTEADISALYARRPIALWVEDELTREYLQAVSGAGDFMTFLVAGGSPGLRSVVHDARRQGFSIVFGYRDRDFGPIGPRPKDAPPGTAVFVSQAHEVENLALDAVAIAACSVNTSGLDAGVIEAQARSIAESLVVWVGCCHVHGTLKQAALRDFPPHPKPDVVKTFDQALDALATATWATRTVPSLPQLVTREGIARRLEADVAVARKQLADGSWLQAFPGKEILGRLLTRVYTKRPPGSGAHGRDLVIAAARVQVEMERVPAEVRELVDVLRSIAGRPAV